MFWYVYLCALVAAARIATFEAHAINACERTIDCNSKIKEIY